jgi:hypothetical protein
MTRPELRERWRRIGEEMRALEPKLIAPTPDNLDACGALLQALLERARADGESLAACRGDGELLETAAAVRAHLRRLGRLLEHAATVHHGRQQFLTGLVAGYTPQGQPAEWRHASRVYLDV